MYFTLVNDVDERNPASAEAMPARSKTRRSFHRSDVATCHCRRQRTDGRAEAADIEFDVDSVATRCLSHVDQLTASRSAVDRTSLLSAGIDHSQCTENALSTATFGNYAYYFCHFRKYTVAQ